MKLGPNPLFDDIDDTNTSVEGELLLKENEEKLFQYQATLKKAQFIEELKRGLGKEIRETKGKIKIVKKPWYNKLGSFLKKIFTKF